jgi:hypothetical protein
MIHFISSGKDWAYKSDLILNPRVIRFRPLEQALQKVELELKATSDFVPALTCITVPNKVDNCTKPLTLVLHSVKRPQGHAKGLANVHSLSRNFIQEEVVKLL